MMDKGEIYRELEKDFTATFIGELIPGILHNFANPLNGIMGRSKILQRRIEENIKKIGEKYPDVALGMVDDLQRIKNDIRALSQESEYFFDMFKDVAGKFYALAAKNEEKVNITQLLAAEMRFVNFYLDFKHEIKRSVQWDKDVPDFKGDSAELSMAFWKIIRFTMSRALAGSMKEFHIRTEYDNKYINVFIKSSGKVIPVTNLADLMENVDSGCLDSTGELDRGFLLSLLLLDKYQAKINIFSEESFNTISIGFPCRNERIVKR